MNNGGDAAEQVVRLSLEGFEVAAKLTGSAAKNVALLLVSVLKQEQQTKGKARLTNMIKSGKELKVFSIPNKDLAQFTKQAKRYGVLYCVLRDKSAKGDDVPVDIIARAEDGMELMLALFNIVQGTISTIMGSAGFSTPQQTVLPPELITSVEECGFFESIPLWAVTLIGGLFITVMSFILIMTVYGRFFKLYMYTALAPIPLSTFAGEPSQNVGKSFIKSYCAVCLEGAVIVLSCIIFSLFASSPPVVNPDAAAVTQVWSYVGELLFNMLVLVGSVKMSDRIIREMMGL